jgi:hypothetical protein
MIGLFIMCLLFLASTVWAEDKPKGPTCQDQLAQTSVQANNLANDRAQKEQALAKEQVISYMLRQQVAQLQKQLDELKQPKAPNPEDKPTP